jgi:hypothetical protein
VCRKDSRYLWADIDVLHGSKFARAARLRHGMQAFHKSHQLEKTPFYLAIVAVSWSHDRSPPTVN